MGVQKTIFVVAVDTTDVPGEREYATHIGRVLESLESRWHRSVQLEIAPTDLGVVELEFTGDNWQYVNTACDSTVRHLQSKDCQVLFDKPTVRVPTTGEVVFRDKGLSGGSANLKPRSEPVETVTYEVNLTGTAAEISALKAALHALTLKVNVRITRI